MRRCSSRFRRRVLEGSSASWSRSGESTLAFLVLFLLVLGCAEHETYRKHSEFEVGMARDAVLSRFGPPDQTQTMVKTSEYVWGPIEDFWAQVSLGGAVEIWSYRTKAEAEGGSGEPIDGFTELYFVGDSGAVDGIGFAVEGAVYEATP